MDDIFGTFTIYHENFRSIVNKKTELLLSTKSLDYDGISINETWLNQTHKNEEFIDAKYNIFRKDRRDSDINANRGGGVLLAIHKKYDCENVVIPEMNAIEAVCVRVSMNGSSLFIYSLYIQNRFNGNNEQDLTIERYRKHYTAITHIKELLGPSDSIVILGDFNMALVKWTIDEHDSKDYGYIPIIGDSNSLESNVYRETVTKMLEMGMHQMCDFKNHAGNVLDLIYSDCPELISIEKADLTLFSDGLRDHAHTQN